MAKGGAVYPQVEPRAAALADRRVAAGRPHARAEHALAACRRVGARALVLGPRRVARAADLARAVSLGLGALPVDAFAWAALPIVSAAAPEIEARRLLASGTPMVLVREGRRVVGVIERDRAGVDGAGMSLAARLDHLQSREDEARLWLLRVAGKIGESMGTPVHAVGGFVRDLMLGRVAPDIDLVVEGDGIAFARRLSEETGGVLTVHEGFGTASIAGAATAGHATLPPVDVASSRRERYERPGALPRVSPGDLADDLMRRDFTINAMALVLAPSGFGRLVDPCGGRHDLRRRVLRPLHPLSFVEDPTRLFRASRYAARLGARFGPDGRAALALALRIGDFPALSGQRLRAEIDLLATESRATGAFDRAFKWQLLRLWDRRFRVAGSARAHLRAVRRFEERAGAAVDGRDLTLLALLAGQPTRVVGACLDRLAVTGEPRRALEVAVAGGGLGERLARTTRPSAIADMLAPLSTTALAGAWLLAPAATRRRIEWFLRDGRAARPILSGEDLIAFGVPRGPAVGLYLSRLRRQRLDGAVKTVGEEYENLRLWLGHPDPATVPARKEALR
jgi:tRNA nucleotidyltransferase (CCA-adding enzyme)